jgi:hypothetical protein
MSEDIHNLFNYFHPDLRTIFKLPKGKAKKDQVTLVGQFLGLSLCP